MSFENKCHKDVAKTSCEYAHIVQKRSDLPMKAWRTTWISNTIIVLAGVWSNTNWSHQLCNLLPFDFLEADFRKNRFSIYTRNLYGSPLFLNQKAPFAQILKGSLGLGNCIAHNRLQPNLALSIWKCEKSDYNQAHFQ